MQSPINVLVHDKMHSKSPGYPELVFKYQAATDKVFVSNPGHGYMQVSLLTRLKIATWVQQGGAASATATCRCAISPSAAAGQSRLLGSGSSERGRLRTAVSPVAAGRSGTSATQEQELSAVVGWG